VGIGQQAFLQELADIGLGLTETYMGHMAAGVAVVVNNHGDMSFRFQMVHSHQDCQVDC
jgi:hypothetical protein